MIDQVWFLGSVVTVVLALVGLGLAAGRTARPVRRFALVRAEVSTDIGDKVRMLVARLAALRVRIDERRA